MDASEQDLSTQSPDGMFGFARLQGTKTTSARLGRLTVPGRKTLDTPNFVPIASRGVVPHLSPDNLRDRTSISSAYLALEDFIERPLDNVPLSQYQPAHGSSPLRSFCALPDDTILLLSPRRVPAVKCLKPNTNSSITIWTSCGAREMRVSEYVAAVQKLRPDIAVAVVDVLDNGQQASKARLTKMGDRSEAWLKLLVDATSIPHARGPAIFAPILPAANELQSQYLEAVEEEAQLGRVHGLAIFNNDSVSVLPEATSALPRLALTAPSGPLDVVNAVALGIDMFTLPFVSTATDYGIALTFRFGGQDKVSTDGERNPLGLDLRHESNTLDTSALIGDCGCYACANHHKAYFHHLLSAKEMLAWTLLQMHNHHVIADFFSAIRTSIYNGTFEEDKAAFEALYEESLPIASGQGPRVRGYQFKSDGLGEEKKNEKAYKVLDLPSERPGEIRVGGL